MQNKILLNGTSSANLAKKIAESTSVVMEGRDITTKVLPDADLKVYMDASEEVRAKRRYQQLIERGMANSYERVLQDIHERDFRDMNRDIDPLAIASDAWVLDTSSLSILQVVDAICDKLKEKKLII